MKVIYADTFGTELGIVNPKDVEAMVIESIGLRGDNATAGIEERIVVWELLEEGTCEFPESDDTIDELTSGKRDNGLLEITLVDDIGPETLLEGGTCDLPEFDGMAAHPSVEKLDFDLLERKPSDEIDPETVIEEDTCECELIEFDIIGNGPSVEGLEYPLPERRPRDDVGPETLFEVEIALDAPNEDPVLLEASALEVLSLGEFDWKISLVDELGNFPPDPDVVPLQAVVETLSNDSDPKTLLKVDAIPNEPKDDEVDPSIFEKNPLNDHDQETELEIGTVPDPPRKDGVKP
jgi:hypothetical protein